MNKRKLTNDEKRDWLLENCVNDNGDLVICDIDLSDFKGNVILDRWKVGGSGSVDLSFWEVKGNLYQNCQKVNGNLNQDYQTAENIYQSCQKVNGNLEQGWQKVKRNLHQSYQTAKNIYQGWQKVSKDLVSQKLKEDEEWVSFQGSDRAVIRAKKLKEISLDELAKMGYKLKEQIKWTI